MIKKLLKGNMCLSSKKTRTALLKDTNLDGLPKFIDRYKVVTLKKHIHLLNDQIYHKFFW